uniref:Uncharacterized protein n=1 Tax=Anguilla anguilla TaxID=7936 RepID=A0A0E9XBM1_ANGAN
MLLLAPGAVAIFKMLASDEQHRRNQIKCTLEK